MWDLTNLFAHSKNWSVVFPESNRIVCCLCLSFDEASFFSFTLFFFRLHSHASTCLWFFVFKFIHCFFLACSCICSCFILLLFFICSFCSHFFFLLCLVCSIGGSKVSRRFSCIAPIRAMKLDDRPHNGNGPPFEWAIIAISPPNTNTNNSSIANLNSGSFVFHSLFFWNEWVIRANVKWVCPHKKQV